MGRNRLSLDPVRDPELVERASRLLQYETNFGDMTPEAVRKVGQPRSCGAFVGARSRRTLLRRELLENLIGELLDQSLDLRVRGFAAVRNLGLHNDVQG